MLRLIRVSLLAAAVGALIGGGMLAWASADCANRARAAIAKIGDQRSIVYWENETGVAGVIDQYSFVPPYSYRHFIPAAKAGSRHGHSGFEMIVIGNRGWVRFGNQPWAGADQTDYFHHTVPQIQERFSRLAESPRISGKIACEGVGVIRWQPAWIYRFHATDDAFVDRYRINENDPLSQRLSEWRLFANVFTNSPMGAMRLAPGVDFDRGVTIEWDDSIVIEPPEID